MILIVDDKPENIFSLKSILEFNKFPVDSASSGEEALRKILRKNYSLIILDVQMPEMDGFEVAEMIMGYSKSKDTPIIFLSAVNKEKSFITRGYKAGAVDYITKPVDPDILLLKVSSLYAMSEQRTKLKQMQEDLLQEIEARKISQGELAAKNEELHSVMESMPQIAFTINKEGSVEFVNKKWLEYLGDKKEFPPLHPDNNFSCLNWKKAFTEGREFYEEVKIKHFKTGVYHHFLLKIIPVVQQKEIVKWVGTFTDIEQQKQVNQLLEQKVKERTVELLDKNKELKLFNDELQQVTWVLSHDLKEPVRKILTYGNLIRENYNETDSAILPYLRRMLESSERMSQLINDLLDYSRSSNGPQFEYVDLDAIIKQVLSDLESSIEEKGAKITVGALPSLEASSVQMRQLLQNLVSNAVKFSKPGIAPEIDISSEIISGSDPTAKADAAGDHCRIVVSDNGIGFNEKFLEKIFQVFQRLHYNKSEGTGIGLAIVKKIIERHNGLITAHSTEGQGSQFIVILPLKNQAKNHAERIF